MKKNKLLDTENSYICCPIDLDRIAIGSLVHDLEKLQEMENKKGYVNNIPRAIHDALQEM